MRDQTLNVQVAAEEDEPMHSRALVVMALAVAGVPPVAVAASRSYEAGQDRQAHRQAQEQAQHRAADVRRELEQEHASIEDQQKDLQAKYEREQRELKEDTQRKKDQLQARAREQNEQLEAKARDERQKLEARFQREKDQLQAKAQDAQQKLGQRQEQLKQQAKETGEQPQVQRADHADHQEAAWWRRDENQASRDEAQASREVGREMSQVSGTITAIDSGQGRLTLREDSQPGMVTARGRSRDLQLDPRATVIYGNDQLQVEDLQVGDRVRVTVDTRDGQPKVRAINVQQTKS